jgi:hypothetical protein
MQNSHSQLINMIATEPDFKGLGTKRAREVVEAFNDDIYERLDSCNAQNFIPPLTHELAVSLVYGLKINKNKKELVKFLDELSRCRERCVIITSDIPDFKWAVGSVPFFKRRRNRLMTKTAG